jgi:hypothetical protein
MIGATTAAPWEYGARYCQRRSIFLRFLDARIWVARMPNHGIATTTSIYGDLGQRPAFAGKPR